MDKHEACWRAMNAAVEWLRVNDVEFDQLTAYHIKIGPVNFWPKTGTIMVDGEDRRRPERGLDGLEFTLIEQGFVDHPFPAP